MVKVAFLVGAYRRNKCGFDVFLAFIHGLSKASPAVLEVVVALK